MAKEPKPPRGPELPRIAGSDSRPPWASPWLNPNASAETARRLEGRMVI